ncbi:hypothetical protein F4679DRAFT_565419 [Xylaria curta]|nr:hypothetical protein F4679DRAFT_565419 [Xylaria curta]
MEQVELGQNHRIPTNPKPAGYAQWARSIASDSDNEPLIFRKFDELAALNLLYLQSEMLHIEAQLRQLDQEEIREPDLETINATRQWEVLVAQCAASRISDRESTTTEPKAHIRARARMGLILKLRAMIKEYHEALLLQNKVACLQMPSQRVLRAVKQMFNQDGFPVLEGQARQYLDAEDLIALKSPTTDPLSNYLRKSWASENEGKSPTEGLPRIGRFKEHKVARWVDIITIIVATVFLIGPIVVLSLVQSPPGKLALIAVFTVGFAASVALITNARRAEIFFGSATYAAVLVVFVSNGDFSGGG